MPDVQPCPYLSLRDDPGTCAAYPRPDHRCSVPGTPEPSLDWQATYCLGGQYTACRFFRLAARAEAAEVAPRSPSDGKRSGRGRWALVGPLRSRYHRLPIRLWSRFGRIRARRWLVLPRRILSGVGGVVLAGVVVLGALAFSLAVRPQEPIDWQLPVALSPTTAPTATRTVVPPLPTPAVRATQPVVQRRVDRTPTLAETMVPSSASTPTSEPTATVPPPAPEPPSPRVVVPAPPAGRRAVTAPPPQPTPPPPPPPSPTLTPPPTPTPTPGLWLPPSVGDPNAPAPTPPPPVILPAPEPTPTPVPAPSPWWPPEPWPTATPTPSRMPKPTPTLTPSVEPTPEPTPLPTAEPTPEPTPLPTTEATPEPIPTESVEPTPTVSETPTEPPAGSPTPIEESTE